MSFICRKEYFGGLLINQKTLKNYKLNDATYNVIKEMIGCPVEQLHNKYLDFGSEFEHLITYFKNIGLIDSEEKMDYVKIIENNESSNLSAPLKVFFEVTSACNLRCKHCFNNSGIRSDDELGLGQIVMLAQQLQEMGVPQIKITGGEPFIREDIISIFNVLDVCDISYVVHTNGIYLNEKIIEGLKRLKLLKSIRVSLDGYIESNDYIRGAGTFRKAIDALHSLKKNNIRCGINYTINRINYNQISHLIKFLKDEELDCDINLGIMKTAGRSKENYLKLQFNDSKELGESLYILKNDIDCNKDFTINNEIEIPYSPQVDNMCEDITYFMGDKFGCSAGQIACTITSKGNVYPCGLLSGEKRFLCGNIKEERLYNIWNRNNTLKNFRELIPNGKCNNCEFFKVKCTGGCRANSYNLNGDIEGIDPNCLYYTNSINQL